MDRSDLLFVITVLRRIVDNAGEGRFRTLQLKSEIVQRVRSVLVEIGFDTTKDGGALLLPETKLGSLGVFISELQDQADSLLDPESITFSQVAEILKRDGQLPGIRSDIDDVVIDAKFAFAETQRPPKPWELDIDPNS